jgi:hypothetical protein
LPLGVGDGGAVEQPVGGELMLAMNNHVRHE